MIDENGMKKNRTYLWFWLLIPLFMFFTFVTDNSKLDMPNETWNSIFPLNYYGIPLYLFLFFSGLGYFFKPNKSNQKLSWIHFITTSMGFLVLTIPKVLFLIGPPRRYYSNTIEPSFVEYLLEMNLISLFAILLITFGVIIYFINLGFVIFKKK